MIDIAEIFLTPVFDHLYAIVSFAQLTMAYDSNISFIVLLRLLPLCLVMILFYLQISSKEPTFPPSL